MLWMMLGEWYNFTFHNVLLLVQYCLTFGCARGKREMLKMSLSKLIGQPTIEIIENDTYRRFKNFSCPTISHSDS